MVKPKSKTRKELLRELAEVEKRKKELETEIRKSEFEIHLIKVAQELQPKKKGSTKNR